MNSPTETAALGSVSATRHPRPLLPPMSVPARASTGPCEKRKDPEELVLGPLASTNTCSEAFQLLA